FISEIVHTEDSFLLKLYYKFNFATEPVFLLIKNTFFKKWILKLGKFIGLYCITAKILVFIKCQLE
ncbi:hypothetical protein ACEPTM_13950, partial [Staphylococcus aureus]